MLIHKREWTGLFCNHGKLNFQDFRCASIYVRFFDLNSALMTYCKLPETGVVSYVFLQCQALALLWRKLLLGKNILQALLVSIDQFSKQNKPHHQKRFRFWFVWFFFIFQNYDAYIIFVNIMVDWEWVIYSVPHILRVIKYWSRFPRWVMESPSLEVVKTQLDTALNNLLWVRSWTRPQPFHKSINCIVDLLTLFHCRPAFAYQFRYFKW